MLARYDVVGMVALYSERTCTGQRTAKILWYKQTKTNFFIYFVFFTVTEINLP